MKIELKYAYDNITILIMLIDEATLEKERGI